MKSIKWFLLIILFLLPEIILSQNRTIEFNGTETRRIQRAEGKELAGPRRDDLGDQIERFNLPYQNNAGLAWDGEYIWGSTRANNRRLFCIDPENFDVIEDFAINQPDAIGMTWDPVDGVFWICEYVAPDNNSVAHLYDREGEHVGEIELPRNGHWGLCTDGEFIYGNNEWQVDPPRIYRFNRLGEEVREGPNIAGLINHGRCVSIEYVHAHNEGHFWVMSVGYISQVAVDFEEGEAEVIREFRAENTDYPHQGLAHDGFNLWAGGQWRQQLGFVYDDGIEEIYGVLELDREFIEFGPVPSGDRSEQVLRIYNRAEEEDELHVLDFTLTDIGDDPDWLELDRDDGEVDAGEFVDVTLTAVTEGIDLGEYERTLRIESSDPDRREVDIPVHLFVVEGFGLLFGTVSNAEDNAPIEGAIVAVEHFGFADTTDEEGGYAFPEIPSWTYDLMVTKTDYHPMHEEGVEIGPREEVEVDFALLHAEFEIDPARIEVTLAPDETEDVPLTISNEGNDALAWAVERVFPEEVEADPWDIRSQANLEELTGDNQLNGVVFAEGHFVVSGGNGGQPVNKIYIFDTDGEQVGEFDQFNESRYGMRDLTWDGTLVWGADVTDDGNILYGFTVNGELEEEINGGADSYRSITWDPDRNVFWSGDITSDIFATDLNGEVTRTIRRPGDVRMYGLAYWSDDPDGYNLYAFARGDTTNLMVSKVNLDNGEAMVAAELDFGEGRPGGVDITNRLDPYSWLFVSMVQGPDHLIVWHIDSRTDWLTVEPVEGIVDPGDRQELTVTLGSEGFRENDELTANLLFTHDGSGGIFEVPVRLSVTGEGGLANRMLRFSVGWSMVSLNIQPRIDDIEQMFAPLVEDGSLILVKDGAGHFFLPAQDFNNIDHWSGVEGYQVKVARRAEIEIGGEAIPNDTPIDLRDGWNMVSYLPRSEVDVTEALSNLGEALEIAKDGRGRFYIPAWNYSNMGLMCEGQGYLLMVDGEAELIYNIGGGRLMAFGCRYSRSEIDWLNEVPWSGSSFSLLLLTEGLDASTRIEAYTPSGILAGRGIVDADGRCGMALWGDDNSTAVIEGFLEGEDIVLQRVARVARNPGFKSKSVSLSKETRAMNSPCHTGSMNRPLRVVDGSSGKSSPTWTADGWCVARLTAQAVPVEFGLNRAYPNPFNGQLRIEITLETGGTANLKAYDLTGREVADIVSGEYPAGSHAASWNAVDLVSGIYIIRLTSAGRSESVKVVMVK